MNDVSCVIYTTEEPIMRLKLLIILYISVITMNSIPEEPAKNVALVKYRGTIYQCQSISKTSCGYTLHCNNITMHCANDLVIENLVSPVN